MNMTLIRTVRRYMMGFWEYLYRRSGLNLDIEQWWFFVSIAMFQIVDKSDGIDHVLSAMSSVRSSQARFRNLWNTSTTSSLSES